jgi:Ser/Thr protein kinase RdoA (MazF antagonist)
VGNQYLKTRLTDIASRYGLHLHRIKPYNSLYKKNAVYRASTDKGGFLIKAFHMRTFGTKLTKIQQSVQVAAYIKKLKQCRYPNMMQWLITKSGQNYVIKNGRLYYMSKWIKGHPLQNDDQEYEALGKALAMLHTLCKDCLPSKSYFTIRQIKLLKFQERLFRRRLTVIRKKKPLLHNGFNTMVFVAAN